MDAYKNGFPILSFLLSKVDPVTHPPLPPHQEQNLLTQFPYLTNHAVQSSLTESIPATTIQTHANLMSMGPRPNPDAVSSARSKLIQAVEPSEIEMYKAVVRLDELHEEYENALGEAEERIVRVYKDVVKKLGDGEVNEEVVAILKEAESGGVVESVNLSSRELRLIPEAFGRLHGLIVLNLCRNLLQILPDSIEGLGKLEELDVSSNLLESLPDSIGLLRNLKVLNVSGNKLTYLPESVALCSSLVELDASFNNLMSLPTNIGHGLVNLEKLSISLNKIRFLPPSICEMKSLRFLDVHFNELHGVPQTIGRLQSLEVLELSSNFTDLTVLPETLGDLTNLRELDLSNNQILALPDSFGRLKKLSKLNLEGNPLEIPPMEIANKGVDAVREFMAKRWQDMMEEQQRSMLAANQQQDQSGWLTWGTSLLSNFVSGVSQTVSGYVGGAKTPRDPYLDQQLHFDTASMYGSEEVLGEAIVEAIKLGLINSREDLFITTKLWCSDAHAGHVVPALNKSLQRILMEYVDLYLIHWPISCKPGTYQYPTPKDELMPMDFKAVWEGMEECQMLGLTKSIGVSNFSCKKLETILSLAKIPPSVNQVELNPVWRQSKLLEFCKRHDIVVTAFSPLGSKGTNWGSNQVMDNPVLNQIAEAHGKTLAQVSLRWIIEQGATVVVNSYKKERLKENLGIFDWKLSKEDYDKIHQIPQNRMMTKDEFVSENGPFKSIEELWDGEL